MARPSSHSVSRPSPRLPSPPPQKETVFPDENKTGPHVHGALQLRFSLLGGVFDAIQRGNLSLTDTWVLLLAQLVTNGVVTLYNNRSDSEHRESLLARSLHCTDGGMF